MHATRAIYRFCRPRALSVRDPTLLPCGVLELSHVRELAYTLTCQWTVIDIRFCLSHALMTLILIGW